VRLVRAALALIVALVASAGAIAQAWPVKPVRLIVPLAAGGNLDIVTRSIAQKLTEALGQQVIVENRAGVNSVVGTEYVARAPADGYTLLLMSSTFLTTPLLSRNVPYDALRDFTGVTLIAWLPQLMVVHPSLPSKTVREFIALAKSRPGEINYASAGTSSVGDLATELFNRRAGIRTNAVPYKGNAPALIDTVGGQVSLFFGAIGPMLPYINGGRLRALGVSSPRRSPLLPEVPAISETLPGYEAGLFIAMVAPAATPREIVLRLHAEIAKIMQVAEMKSRLAQLGDEISVSSSPEQFTAFLKTEFAKWDRIIKEAGIKVE
jgi:tripartite-type tricarboxylate transporter receptor subunit TctC